MQWVRRLAAAAAALSCAWTLFASLAIGDESDAGRTARADRAAGARAVWSGPGAELYNNPSAFLPIPELPTEDVDVVEVLTIHPFFPNTLVWPVEGVVHFMTSVPGPPALYASLPTVSPNISGVDFSSDGTWGVFQTLGFGYIYDMSVPSVTATLPLPGPVPSRRDIDPMIIPDAGSVSGFSAVFFTGTGVHSREIPGGALRWDITLPTAMVEAVDPAFSNEKLWVPSEGFVTVIDPVAGAVLSTTSLGAPLVREVDLRFSGPPGPAFACLPVSGALWSFDDTPISGGGIGAPLGTIPLPSPLIEGNDMEIDPTGTFGFLPTLSTMLQIDLTAPVPTLAFAFPFFGTAHQRNQDAVFTPIGPPARAAYCTQGLIWIYDVFGGGIGPTTLASPGVLVDGVDPSFGDTPPFGEVVSVATLASTNVFNAVGYFTTGIVPHPPGFGALLTDVDHKPGPVPGNYLVQPTVGGLLSVSGFLPSDWVVSSTAGLEIVDLSIPMSLKLMTYPSLGAGLAYRGGDAQPLFNNGPAEPAFSVDNPDQDFLTKCWEYKYATQRWPYWYYHTLGSYYPAYVPYGVFGPPAYTGYDLLNHVKVVMLDGNQVGILDPDGNHIHTVFLPNPPIGGLIWDYDHKICKIRLYGQQEAVIDLTPLALNPFNPPLVSFVPYGSFVRWYPVVDRRNGWEFVVQRGGTRLWIHDHVYGGVASVIDLPARVIRRPVFDEQSKRLCLTLSNRRLAFIDAHRLRLGYPISQYLYYSPVLPAHVIDVPVFDLYNHMAVVQLHGSSIAVMSTANGSMLWWSGPLPYWPRSPLHIDCYNKKAKGFYRGPLNDYEMWCDLYPLAFGLPPILQWITLPGVPYGYPWYDSKNSYEFIRIGSNVIQYRNVHNILAFGSIATPFPIRGALFLDRVNKYGLCALSGNRLFYMNLFRVTSGLPGASHVINLPAGVQAEDDIVFTHTHHALVHLDNGTVATIDLINGTYVPYPVLVGLPRLTRQLYAHPYRGLVNYPWYDPGFGFGGEVTIDMAPTRWSPPQQPGVVVQNLPAPPLDALDFTPPFPIAPFQITHLGYQFGDAAGIRHGAVLNLEPGATLMVVNQTKENTLRFMAPYEATADQDGQAEFSMIADSGDVVCFTPIDPAGNAGPPTCVNAPTVDAPLSAAITRLSLSLASGNPVRGEARFALEIAEAGRATLEIYDVGGRRIARLLDGSQPAGARELTWRLTTLDGDRVRAGVYLAILRSASDEATTRLVVVE